jgi:hypothetical protein
MKKIILQLLMVVVSINVSYAQRMKQLSSENNSPQISLITDVNLESGATSSIENAKAASGKLGFAVVKKSFYGSANIAVVSSKSAGTGVDSNNIKPFASNLLIPSNSSQGLSNFSAEIGFKSLSGYNSSLDNVALITSPISFKFFKEGWCDSTKLQFKEFKDILGKRLGINGYWQLNNTIWKKDSISTPVFISSFGVFLTYNVLSMDLTNNDNADKVNWSFFCGWDARRLGGDYGLDKNESMRKYFLNTNSIAWNSFSYGSKVEIGKFYGKVQISKFVDDKLRNGSINGFSGFQATISMGIYLDLKLATSNKYANIKKEPKLESVKPNVTKEKETNEPETENNKETKTINK